jgi:hypothetical protein
MPLSRLLAGALVGAVACATTSADVYPRPIHVESAELVPIEPGSAVASFADSDVPIFATDHAYWMYAPERQAWYRAVDYRTGSWTRISEPPERLRRIAHPLAYVHFRRHDNSAAMILLRR